MVKIGDLTFIGEIDFVITPVISQNMNVINGLKEFNLFIKNNKCIFTQKFNSLI